MFDHVVQYLVDVVAGAFALTCLAMFVTAVVALLVKGLDP